MVTGKLIQIMASKTPGEKRSKPLKKWFTFPIAFLLFLIIHEGCSKNPASSKEPEYFMTATITTENGKEISFDGTYVDEVTIGIEMVIISVDDIPRVQRLVFSFSSPSSVPSNIGIFESPDSVPDTSTSFAFAAYTDGNSEFWATGGELRITRLTDSEVGGSFDFSAKSFTTVSITGSFSLAEGSGYSLE